MAKNTKGIKEQLTYYTNLINELRYTYLETKETILQIYNNAIQVITLIMAIVPLVRLVCSKFKEVFKRNK